MRRTRTTISCSFLAAIVALTVGAESLGAAPDQDTEASFRVFPSAVEWTTEVVDGPVAAPVIAGDHVIVASRSGAITGLRLADRVEAWKTKLPRASHFAGSDEIVLAVAGETAHALAADTGQLQWTRPIKPLTAPPLLRKSWIVLASGENLTALRASDGSVVWTLALAPMLQKPTIDGDTLYVPVVDGRLVALDLASGTVRWEAQVGPNPSEALAYGDRVYVGAAKRFVCVKAKTGEEDWAPTIGAAVIGAAAADDSYIYVASMDNLLRAFQRSNGNRAWQQDVRYRPISGPVVTGSTVSVPGRTAVFPAFDRKSGKPTTGKLALSLPAATAWAFSPPRNGAPGRLAVITNDPGKPWLLVLASEPPPAPPEIPQLTPLSVLPGTSLPIPKHSI